MKLIKKLKYILILFSILVSTYCFSVDLEETEILTEKQYLAELLIENDLYSKDENAIAYINTLTEIEIDSLIDSLELVVILEE